MPASKINFFTEEVTFTLKNKAGVRAWLQDTITAESYKLDELNFIFCSDEYLLRLNKQYLDHDTYTDIITFDNSAAPGIVLGDVFISLERVKENAESLSIQTQHELRRVMVHGLLHLLGFKDKSKSDKSKMTEKENFYLRYCG